MWRARRLFPRLTPVLLILSLVAPPAAARPEVDERDDDGAAELAAIEATLADYLEGGRSGDVDRLRRAFHPSARLQFVRDGQYHEWALEEYLGARTPGRRSGHRTRVLSIDFAGTSATAKLELDFGGYKFIDYMSLLKIDGRWWIVNKVFYRAE